MTESHGRSLPWFRVDVDIVDHPKIHSLATHLEVSEDEAGWSIIRLFAWTMRYAARGRLAPGARTALGRLAPVRVTSDRFVDGLISAGWVDALADGSLEIHDWDEHNGAAVAKAEKDAERKRAARARRSNGRGQSADRRADGAGNGTERNGTEHIEATAPLAPPRREKSDKRPRDSDLLVQDFKAVTGSDYLWQGAKDGTALAALLRVASLEEVRNRWRRGLSAPTASWASCRTVAQLRSKWNDLGEPVRDITKGVAPVSDWATIGEDGGVF